MRRHERQLQRGGIGVEACEVGGNVSGQAPGLSLRKRVPGDRAAGGQLQGECAKHGRFCGIAQCVAHS